MKKYLPQEFETGWIDTWMKKSLFQGTGTQENVTEQNKMYLLYAFAYPSGSGLHVGHVEPVTALDILARYYWSIGKKVFFPVGWDAFGLPAENYAIKTGVHPAETTSQAIDNFRSQIKRIGVSYDWASEIATCHPGYYRWTQWLFLLLYKKGLAYKKKAPVNWCPSCQTVLANEQVVEGTCERCGTEVVQKEMSQWFFKITDYKDELISGLDKVDWPKATKQQQLNWIGKSEGVTYHQKVKGMDIELEAYDSVPQTFMAQTFSVIAPEHPMVSKLVKGTKYEEPVRAFVEKFKKRKVENRFHIDREIEGIFTGRYIENPFGTGDLPIWIATFVIAEYGSGFVNSSAHDPRDFAFAKKYDIPLRPVMFPKVPVEAEKVRNLEYCYHHAPEGVLTAPKEFAGRKWGEVRADIIDYIEKKDFGKRTTQYKLRDWLISRQRYWGAPIPIVYDPEGNAHPVKNEHLPWKLPTDVDFKPTGESPLKRSQEFKERVEKLYGSGWTPEYDTMDTFVDSSWYYLRYTDPRSEDAFADTQNMKKWMPIDFYMIGPEHIVLHLLYSRFFTKFLRDEGYVAVDEPFLKMRHQGMILGPDNRKMSKSKGNVINPDDVIDEYGADTLRLYEMFMGPIDADKPWNETSVQGLYRFLKRVWRMYTSQTSPALRALPLQKGDLKKISLQEGSTERSEGRDVRDPLTTKLNLTIKKVGDDIASLKFNTAIAAMMEYLNEWEKIQHPPSDIRRRPPSKGGPQKDLPSGREPACGQGRYPEGGRDVYENEVKFLKILSPFAPFMTEEIWHTVFQKETSIHEEPWPAIDERALVQSEVEIPIQINGKVRATVFVPTDADQDLVLSKALLEDKVKKYVREGTYKKIIFIPGKILNIIV